MKSFSKSNFVKVFGSATLATLIATAGIFAFVPFSASAQSNSNSQNSSLSNNLNNSANNSNDLSSENTGLITPRADDPVLFTTENGLEIKYGNVSVNLNGSSGAFSQYPYFTTTKNDNIYTWLIIGHKGIVPDISPAGSAILADQAVLLHQVLNGVCKGGSGGLSAGEILCWANATLTGSCSNGGLNGYPNGCENAYTNDDYGLYDLKSLVVHKVSSAGSYTGSGALHFFNLSYSGSLALPYFVDMNLFTTTDNFWLADRTNSNSDPRGYWYALVDGVVKSTNASRGCRPAFVLNSYDLF